MGVIDEINNERTDRRSILLRLIYGRTDKFSILLRLIYGKKMENKEERKRK